MLLAPVVVNNRADEIGRYRLQNILGEVGDYSNES